VLRPLENTGQVMYKFIMITPQESLLGAIKYFQTRFTGRPKLVNLEITKLCNAKCDFCDYWQTRHEERIYDYRPVIKLINPSSS